MSQSRTTAGRQSPTLTDVLNVADAVAWLQDRAASHHSGAQRHAGRDEGLCAIFTGAARWVESTARTLEVSAGVNGRQPLVGSAPGPVRAGRWLTYEAARLRQTAVAARRCGHLDDATAAELASRDLERVGSRLTPGSPLWAAHERTLRHIQGSRTTEL